MAQADEIHASAEVVDRNDQFGHVVVDLQVLHVVRCRLPVGQRDMVDAVGQQRLDEALPLVVVGDHRRVARMRRVDERGNAAWLPIVAQHHGAQIEAHLVRRRELGPQVAVDPDVLLDEPEVLRGQLRALFPQGGRHGHRPERGHAGQQQAAAFTGGVFGMRNPFAWRALQGATIFVESIAVRLATVRTPPHRRVM